jgi:hypothetical protein
LTEHTRTGESREEKERAYRVNGVLEILETTETDMEAQGRPKVVAQLGGSRRDRTVVGDAGLEVAGPGEDLLELLGVREHILDRQKPSVMDEHRIVVSRGGLSGVATTSESQHLLAAVAKPAFEILDAELVEALNDLMVRMVWREERETWLGHDDNEDVDAQGGSRR